MGFRFRKSANLGGGFRLNFSKSGVGGSWGTKGFRVTKKANGGTRTTMSIPGTGLSYVSDSKKKSGSSSGTSCLGIIFVWPFKLIGWLIYGVVLLYWIIIKYCFVVPIKALISYIKKKKSNSVSSEQDDSEINSEE